jgi:hypothetical protein
MNWLKGCVALLIAVGAAGCASAPETSARAGTAETATGSAPSSAVNLASTEVTPDLTVDATEQNPGGRVVCRDILKQGSNVIVTRCMTLDAWEVFERIQEQQAKEFLRAVQGGTYRY